MDSLTEEFALEVGEKQVRAVAVEPKGGRMVTGGLDCVLKYWDFAGMVGNTPRPFRQFVPVESHAINALSYSPPVGLLRCVAGTARARIFDREGGLKPILETAQGDPYVRTPENTHGHTHAMTTGIFNPTSPELFLTAGSDATVRLWDVNVKRVGMDQYLPHATCLKAVDSRGVCAGISVSSAGYSGDASKIVAGCSDGSIQIFSGKSQRHAKPEIIGRGAHGAEISHAEISDLEIVTRSLDGTLKLWDLRKLKNAAPVRVWENLPTSYQLTNFQRISRQVLTGTSDGRIVTIDLDKEGIVSSQKFATSGIIRTLYHPELNQLFLSCADGNLFFCFDREKSTNGALLFVDKSLKKKSNDGFSSSAQPIFNYEELISGGEYRETRTGRIRKVTETDYEVRLNRLKEMQKPTLSVTADPVVGFGMRAKLNEDPREALLKYAQEADRDSEFTGAAYRESQPEKLLDFTEESTPADELLRAKKICTRCGLKICTCGYLSYLAGNFPSSAGPSVSSKKTKY